MDKVYYMTIQHCHCKLDARYKIIILWSLYMDNLYLIVTFSYTTEKSESSVPKFESEGKELSQTYDIPTTALFSPSN